MRESICNRVLSVNNKDIDLVKQHINASKEVYLVEFDGYYIQSWEDYIREIQSKFRFPTPCFDSIDRYLDWMRDLDWLHKDGVVLIIYNFSSFLNNDPELKKQIISDFEDTILPFWCNEVSKVVVGGKSKPFMVYLVD